jgi:hypothetical protein
MERDQLCELHYITPISNVPSILDRGLLSHTLAMKIRHDSIAKAEVQDRRRKVVIPHGLPLHHYVNLYFCARNPMLFARQGQHDLLAVLRIDTAVLDLPGVVVSDQNAASRYARFGASPAALRFVDYQRVFAKYWTAPDEPIAEWRNKSIKCAEVLVPRHVEPMFILGVYVSGQRGNDLIVNLATSLRVTVDPDLFFIK